MLNGALMGAAENGHAEVVKVLLEHAGADVNVQDSVSSFVTPLYFSILPCALWVYWCEYWN